jgi:glycosyltransferase involved in cell wall biosynthesis
MGVSASRRLRVALVAPSLGILGGQAVQADRLLAAWRGDSDVEAWLVPVNPEPPFALRPARRVKYARTVATQLVYWPLLVRELRRADVIHVFSASYFSFLLAPLPAFAVARALGKPVLLNYHSGEAPDHLSRSAVARWMLARVQRNVVPSGFLKDVFASYGIDSVVIPNIVELERYRFRERRTLRPRLLSTRNFEDLYNVACTLRAFRIVQERYPEASLTLVGDGRARARLERLASELKLRHVVFAGRISPDDMWRYYDAADVYVQTPDIDNMPISVLEAYASGLPVVSTDPGGVPYIVGHEREGLLVERGSHEAVARAVLRLLNSPALVAQVVAGGRRLAQTCTWEAVGPRWKAIYRQLAAAPALTARPAESLR